ncbi:TPA: hypothetical protein QCX62_003718 [Bacillus paranthracis]|nr:hypothetical protein [Bacillus paranthracis]
MVSTSKYVYGERDILEVRYTLGLIYFIITDEYARFVSCEFSEDKALDFFTALSCKKITKEIDRIGTLMYLEPLKGGGFNVSIKSKATIKGLTLNQEQTKELVDLFQIVGKQ